MLAANQPTNEPTSHYQVAVIGGGIAGLSTAYYLQQAGLQYTVLEQSDRWGGKIKTDHIDDGQTGRFVIEGGPDSFISQKPWALQLARELGLEDRLLGTNDDRRQTFVLNNGRPTPLPDGVLLIVPTKIMPFALSPLLSPLGKLRMGFDLFIPAKRDGQDETLADFITRRLGSEALDKIAEPLMSGIYNAEAEKQSLLATFPRFRALEEKHGSLIRGMLASRRPSSNGAGPQPAGPNPAVGKPVSMFVSFKDGTTELVQSLLQTLTGDLRLDAGVQAITQVEHGYELDLSDGRRLAAEALVLAIPAYAAAGLIRNLAPEAAATLESIRYVSTGTISLAFRRDEVDILPGFGLVIPRSENRPINAVTISSTKFDRRAPDDHVLLRVFFGGSRQPRMMDVADDDLLAIVRDELRLLLGIAAEPVFHRIYRWFQANPQYDVGHLERVEAIEAALPPGLYVTGSPYRGIGLPDCIHQGQQTAAKVAEELVAVTQAKHS